MTKLLELKEQIRMLYLRADWAFRAAGKFLLSFAVFCTILWKISLFNRIQGPLVSLGMAAVCACLPANMISLAMSLLMIFASWQMASDIGIVCILLFILAGFLCFILKPEHTVLMAVSMAACTWNFSGILPITVGLLFGPIEVIPVCLGTAVSGMITVLTNNYSLLLSAGSRLSAWERVVYFLSNFAGNQKMLWVMSAVALSILAVYLIRILPHANSWKMAIACGLVVYVMMMMAGNLIFHISIVVPALAGSCLLGVFCGLAAMLFSFMLDGARTEYLEYEDDEYHYFVKAIPKVRVTVRDKKVTKITEREDIPEEGVLNGEEYSKGFLAEEESAPASGNEKK